MDLELGAFGEDTDERPGLVRIALGHAHVPAESAVLVGDTPADVRGGTAAGVHVVRRNRTHRP
ncbi:HAD hydrolase-like protein [Streptomyces sp. DASNCL29]|uniref:HAD hydrolase-like protein n=1 Tax=Streptomyces sp. DASNCL29 TaxID=2583819 RepID=UPI003211D41E